MSDQSVQVTIVVGGENRAGKVLKEVEKDAEGVANKLKHAAEKSGDVERGFMGLKDVLGTMDGPLQRIADLGGGLEAILKGFGGIAGAAVAGIALVGAGAAYLYQQHEEAQKKAHNAEADQLEALKGNNAELARRYGLSKDALGVAEADLTIAGSRAKLAAAVEQARATEEGIARALGEKDTERVLKLREQLGTIKDQLGYANLQVQAAQRLAAVEARRHLAQVQAASERDIEDAEISRIGNTRTRLTEQETVARQRQLETEAKLKAARMDRLVAEERLKIAGRSDDGDWAEKSAKDLREKADAEKALIQEKLAGEGKLFQIRQEQEQYEQQRRQQGAAAAARAKAARDREAAEAKRRQDERLEFERMVESDMEAQRGLASDIAREAYQADLRQKQDLEAARDAMRQTEIAGTENPAERRRLQLMDEEIRITREMARVREDYTIGEALRTTKLVELQMRLTNAAHRTKKENDAERKAEMIAGANLAMETTSVLVDGLAKVGVAERSLAATQALIAAAKGAMAIVDKGPLGIPQAIMGGFAALQFATAAGTSPPTMPGGFGAGGGGSPGSGAAGITPQGGAPRSLVINVMGGAYVGTVQQIAKHVNHVQRSLQGTGYQSYGGA